ncbi:hypothetical protein CBM2617_B60072 [Cupriavidus taiwanensis]|nr:hypothetical protein CBM2617_B60072 [Cupriavidus taiwanensis]
MSGNAHVSEELRVRRDHCDIDAVQIGNRNPDKEDGHEKKPLSRRPLSLQGIHTGFVYIRILVHSCLPATCSVRTCHCVRRGFQRALHGSNCLPGCYRSSVAAWQLYRLCALDVFIHPRHSTTSVAAASAAAASARRDGWAR